MTGREEKQSLKGLIFTSMRNKILVGVLLFCMLVNGFVPRSIESKESLFVVMSAVVSNAIVEVFNECRDTLTVMSNKITKDLYKFLMLGEVGTEAANKGDEKKEPMPTGTIRTQIHCRMLPRCSGICSRKAQAFWINWQILCRMMARTSDRLCLIFPVN